MNDLNKLFDSIIKNIYCCNIKEVFVINPV